MEIDISKKITTNKIEKKNVCGIIKKAAAVVVVSSFTLFMSFSIAGSSIRKKTIDGIKELAQENGYGTVVNFEKEEDKIYEYMTSQELSQQDKTAYEKAQKNLETSESMFYAGFNSVMVGNMVGLAGCVAKAMEMEDKRRKF